MDKEFRSVNGLEYKEENEGKLILEGYPIVFEQETLIGDEKHGFYEVIDRNAIDESALKDCCLKYNHENSPLILARVRNKSLQLTIDDHGVKMRAELQSDVTTHKDVYNLVKSQLLDKMSFAFTVQDYRLDRSGNLPKKRITKIGRVFEVSIVDIPAYDGTELHARSIEMVENEIAALEKEEQEKRNSEVELEKLKWKIRLGLN